MSNTDFDAIARELLPCKCSWSINREPKEHLSSCPAFYRPAIAQRLRELVEPLHASLEELEHDNATLQDMAARMWRALTPEKRHELNLAAIAKAAK